MFLFYFWYRSGLVMVIFTQHSIINLLLIGVLMKMASRSCGYQISVHILNGKSVADLLLTSSREPHVSSYLSAIFLRSSLSIEIY